MCCTDFNSKASPTIESINLHVPPCSALATASSQLLTLQAASSLQVATLQEQLKAAGIDKNDGEAVALRKMTAEFAAKQVLEEAAIQHHALRQVTISMHISFSTFI